MNDGRWSRIESITVEALELDRERRAGYLAEACGDDDVLRRGVESLLAYDGAVDGFLARTALEEAALAIAADEAAGIDPWQIAGYRVLSRLGEGGMGEVYCARDLQLDREVAIKVVRVTAGDGAVTARFQEEARAASALNHPNIVTIHAVGSNDEVAFIVMEMVRGTTLRAKLANGPLPFDMVVDVAAQLADGLAAAHAAGIVHRDLKPENVMVTDDGRAKILDFGIARRDPSGSRGSGTGLSVSGRTAGTIGYMAPEQASGGLVDHRADQFALGAILFEMLCGSRFVERSSSQSNGEIAADGTPSLQAAGEGGVRFARIVTRCLSESPDDRYAETTAVAAAIRALHDSLASGQERGISRRSVLWWVGGAAMASAAAGVVAWRMRPAVMPRRRVVVLPFANAAGDEETESLCDGITEVLIHQLARVPALAVTSRNTAFQFKGRSVDATELGRSLGANVVLNGSVARRAGRARVTVELVNAADNTRLWGEVFDRPDTDVLATQVEIADAILTQGLHLELTDDDRRRMNGMLTGDAEAYRLFLRAVHYLRLEDEDDYRTARTLLTEAVTRDGAFALGFLTLASTYSIMAIDGFEPPRAAWPRSHEYVGRALAQDPQLPDAHAERAGEAFFFSWDWPTARREWDAALNSRQGRLQPELLDSYVLQEWALGRSDEALRFARAARADDPLSPMLAVREADVLASRGDLQEAASAYLGIVNDWPGEQRAYLGLADVRRSQRRFNEALDLWRMAYAGSADERVARLLATAQGEEGCRAIERAMAERELEQLEDRTAAGAYVSPLDLARAHARMDDRERALSCFEAAFEDRSAALVFLQVDRAWDPLRADPRFGAAVKRVGLA